MFSSELFVLLLFAIYCEMLCHFVFCFVFVLFLVFFLPRASPAVNRSFCCVCGIFWIFLILGVDFVGACLGDDGGTYSVLEDIYFIWHLDNATNGISRRDNLKHIQCDQYLLCEVFDIGKETDRVGIYCVDILDSGGDWYVHDHNYKGIRTEDGKFHGAPLKMADACVFDHDGMSVKYEQKIGGGFVKLLGEDFDQFLFHGDTEYTIMFGSDIGDDLLKKEEIKYPPQLLYFVK